jgi:hypothetical protein
MICGQRGCGGAIFPSNHWWGDYGDEEEGSTPNMDEGMPNMKTPMDPFGRIIKLEAELEAWKALVEEYKAKIEKLELIRHVFLGFMFFQQLALYICIFDLE